MAVQISNVIGTNIYRMPDKPLYHTGNKVLIGVAVYPFFLFIVGAEVFYVWINRHRSRVWDAMTHEENAHYLSTTADKGNKRLDF
ncbi:hypothetical protein LTR66_001488 [Elasticomyces elasticus]|nr:hypothetical protein LTR66_001488 [Elasticomyces elasticus]